MSNMNVTPKLISEVWRSWEKEETKELIEAIKAELKKDLRRGMHRRNFPDEVVEALVENVENPLFWDQLNLLINNFGFDF